MNGTEDHGTNNLSKNPIPIALHSFFAYELKPKNPLLCTHSLHTSFKGFREGRRMHTSSKGFIEGRRMHTSFKGFIEGRRMHTSFKGFIKRKRKRRKRRRQQQQQLVLSSKDNKQAGCTFVVSEYL
jgi:hypothetical protein